MKVEELKELSDLKDFFALIEGEISIFLAYIFDVIDSIWYKLELL